MDSFPNDKRRAIMRKVKSQETTLEKILRSALWKAGIRFRKNDKSLFGKPDVSIKRKRIVIFVDSCFWHGCREHVRMPKTNRQYWIKKIERNVKRDAVVSEYYKETKWLILRVWEHQLNIDLDKIVNEIKST